MTRAAVPSWGLAFSIVERRKAGYFFTKMPNKAQAALFRCRRLELFADTQRVRLAGDAGFWVCRFARI